MSANMTMPEQIDGLEKLLALAKLTPDNIIATQKIAREQLQLTQIDQGKLAEAKTYIAQHESLASELKGREDTLAVSKEAHAKAIADFATYVASENIRLETLAAKLDAREKENIEIDKRNTATEKRLADDRATFERQQREAATANDVAAKANAQVAKDNETEAQRLKDWETTLKRKAELARQQMANF